MASVGDARMLLVGDIVGTGHPGGLRFFLEMAAPELRRGDFVFGNVEFPLAGGGREGEDAAALEEAGFHVVSLANHRIMDDGPEGLLQTIGLLDARGVAHCGAGRNLSEARKPVILDRNGLRVAFLAYTSVFQPHFRALDDRPGMATVQVSTAYMPPPRVVEQPATPPLILTFPNQADLEGVRRDIASARAEAHAVVVSWHWGLSLGYRKRVPYQTELGRVCIDAGASLVVGHHPHVLQGVEVYRSGAICYSLGDFVYWTGRAPGPHHDRNSVMVECQVDHTGLRAISFRPVAINAESQPEVVHGGRWQGVLDTLESDSAEFGTPFRREGERLVLVR